MTRAKRGQNTGTVPLRPRKDGRYEARLTLPDGRRKSFYGATWKEAEDRLNAARADLKRGALPADGRMTVRELWEAWQEANPRNIRESTMRMHGSRWKHHILPVVGRQRLATLTPVHIQHVVTTARAAGLKDSTVHEVYASLRMVLSQGVRWHVIPANPASSVTVPNGESRLLPLDSPDQVKALFAAMHSAPHACALLLGAGLGLRSSEARALKWGDIDLDQGVLHIRRGVTVRKGEIIWTPPKTRTSERTLPIPTFIADALKTRRTDQKKQRLKARHWEEHDLVLTNGRGRPFHPNTLIRATRDAAAAAGLPDDIAQQLTYHHLRHVCATVLVMQKVAPRIAQGILGHATIDMTMRIYSHVMHEMLREGTDAMDDAVSGFLSSTVVS